MKQTMVTGLAVMAFTAALHAATYQGLMQQAGSLLDQQQQPALAAPVYAAALAAATGEADQLAARTGLGVSWVRACWQTGDNAQLAQGLALIEEVLRGAAATPEQRAQCLSVIAEGQARDLLFEAARGTFEKVAHMEAAPARYRGQAWAGIGDAEYALERYPEARAAYERALAMTQAGSGLNGAQRGALFWDAQRGLGRAWSAEGRYAEAAQAYAAVLESEVADEKSKAAARIEIINARYEAGNYPEACAGYLAAWDKLGGPARLRVAMRLDTIYRLQLQKADRLLEAGQYAAARREYAQVLVMEKAEAHHQAAAHLGMGDAWAAEKKHPEAAGEYERVLGMPGAHRPDQGRAQMGLARIFEAEGKKDAARKAYEKLLAMKNVSRFDAAEARARLGAQ